MKFVNHGELFDWRNGRRREVQLQDVGTYDTHRMSLVRKTFYKSTGSTRAVMLGSVLSPACLAVHFMHIV